MKKLLSLLLAVALIAVSFTVPALADEATATDVATATDSEITLPPFSGNVPNLVFKRLKFEHNEVEAWPVHSAPSSDSWRGADGYANLSTNSNGGIWYIGWEENWLLVAYAYKANCWRVGYVNNKFVKDRVEHTKSLSLPRKFVYEPATVADGAIASDDFTFNGEKVTLDSPEVTVLCTLQLLGAPAYYVEGSVDGKVWRGFVSELN